MSEKNIYQSKWGYHPVSLETSKKLRYINMVYSRAQNKAGAWTRWENKAPHNRVIKRTLKNEKGVKIGSEVVGPWAEPLVFSIFHNKFERAICNAGKPWEYVKPGAAKDNGLGVKLLAASRIARTPAKTPEEVRSLDFSEEEIDNLYQKAKDWMNSIK